MFERFTKDARDVVRGAVEHAEGAGAQSVEAEHMLLALLDREASRASFGLAALGLADRKESVRHALAEARRRAGLTQADTDALAGLGIDVSEIVARVEEAHGVGAMSGDRKDRSWWSGRRSFGRDAKEVLERSLRIAVAHRDRHVGDEHILLALTARPGVPAEVLADHGVTHEALMRVLYGGGEAKAG
ncbi:peptidase [Streptomyces sp. MMG1533]|uniref:Clp protease N-terminal domain-containing protein n=1 Tax=Streptomyces sp. MMG1533 TaxID=1415546 RepID=UPI0006ADD812|nr:Clp protease N-terminal domain-containing protein [Streptomyces sp. MMG1533]KOU67569.1 peptidase [Streptomyces sp. MMG1533]